MPRHLRQPLPNELARCDHRVREKVPGGEPQISPDRPVALDFQSARAARGHVLPLPRDQRRRRRQRHVRDDVVDVHPEQRRSHESHAGTELERGQPLRRQRLVRERDDVADTKAAIKLVERRGAKRAICGRRERECRAGPIENRQSRAHGGVAAPGQRDVVALRVEVAPAVESETGGDAHVAQARSRPRRMHRLCAGGPKSRLASSSRSRRTAARCSRR